MPDIGTIANFPVDQQTMVVAIKDHINDLDFRRFIPSKQMSIVSGATETFSGVERRLTFAEATNNSNVRFDFLRPNYWTYGKVEVSLIYHGSASTTANIRFLFSAQSTSLGEVNPGSGFDINGASEIFAGPGTAGALTVTALTNRLPIDALTFMMEFAIFRDGTHASDTYGGDVNLMGAILLFIPTRQ